MNLVEYLMPKVFSGNFTSSMELLYQTSHDWMESGSDLMGRYYLAAQPFLHNIKGPVYEFFLCLKKGTEGAHSTDGKIVFISGLILLLAFLSSRWRKEKRKVHIHVPTSNITESQHSPKNQNIHSDLFDMAKTAFERGHTETVIEQTEEQQYDVNSGLPTNDLSLFLCACISGHYRLIRYMLKKGGCTVSTTAQGDSPLYLATYGVLNSPLPDLSVLEELLRAGCKINNANVTGYTPLHQAASRGNLYVVKYLLMKGADPYAETVSGIRPIDSAVNAGHIEVAELLAVDITNPHVWDIVDPHTPPRISQGLLSPRRKLLMESPPKKRSIVLL